MKFNDLTLIPPLLRAVAEAGYENPSPIQQKAIPPVLAGRDLLGCAQTGTGKTAAFALPILQLLQARAPRRKGAIRCLVLTPTRELALQIEESFEAYGKHLPLRSTVVFGGVGQAPQVAQLKRGVDILVATPGRLNDLIGQGYIKLDAVEVFVLDEADRMLDMGFVNDVKKVLKFLPQQKQTLLFSATMPAEIVELANGLLHKPARVFVTPVSSTVDSIDQRLYRVDKANKRKLLASLLKTADVTSALVFTRTKHGADRVVRELSKAGIKAMAIHGNKSQNARQDALGRFKEGKMGVLVATDIAARGIDINELSHVFNYDLPNVPETYVHRIGRTGRAGHGGTAVSFANYDELEYLADIEKLIGFKIPEVTEHPWPMEVFQKAEKQARPPRPGSQQPAQGPKATGGRDKKTGDKKPGKGAGVQAPLPPAVPAKAGQRDRDRRAEKPRLPLAAQPAKAAVPAPKNGKADKPARPTNARRMPDPYDNLTGGRTIVTKRPVWAGQADAEFAGNQKKPNLPGASRQMGKGPDRMPAAGEAEHEGEKSMNRNNKRRRGKKRGKSSEQAAEQKEGGQQARKDAEPAIPKNEKGVFQFTDEELATDDSLQVIPRKSSEAKYASFEDFLKDH